MSEVRILSWTNFLFKVNLTRINCHPQYGECRRFEPYLWTNFLFEVNLTRINCHSQYGECRSVWTLSVDKFFVWSQPHRYKLPPSVAVNAGVFEPYLWTNFLYVVQQDRTSPSVAVNEGVFESYLLNKFFA